LEGHAHLARRKLCAVLNELTTSEDFVAQRRAAHALVHGKAPQNVVLGQRQHVAPRRELLLGIDRRARRSGIEPHRVLQVATEVRGVCNARREEQREAVAEKVELLGGVEANSPRRRRDAESDLDVVVNLRRDGDVTNRAHALLVQCAKGVVGRDE
jgi:hypothetical protein